MCVQVGMGATLLDGVVMEPGSIVAAGAVVPPGGSCSACVLQLLQYGPSRLLCCLHFSCTSLL
jgi:carbonic anhydrase/acetyltransferase-like protein (isoleucine patch superfamily)